MRSYLVFTAALVASSSAASSGAAYKCVGADGKVSFSDQRCESEALANTAPAQEKVKPPSPGEERLRQIEAVLVDRASNDEQKTAAMLEAGNIRRGLEAQMKPADRERREVLMKELAGTDSGKRAAALRELRSLYRE